MLFLFFLLWEMVFGNFSLRNAIRARHFNASRRFEVQFYWADGIGTRQEVIFMINYARSMACRSMICPLLQDCNMILVS